MGKYEELSRKTLEGIGGIENIEHLTHCGTRLRITYRKKDQLDETLLKHLPECAGSIIKDRQVQVIIGPEVNDAYNVFLKVSGWNAASTASGQKLEKEEFDGPRNASYWLNRFGNFVAPIFMPVVPAMITGGMILAIKNLLTNYFGVPVDSGTAQLMLAIFQAGFAFFPIYIGYTLAAQLKMQPIMGAFLGAVLISDMFSGGTVTDFFGIAIPQISYKSTIVPVILGVSFMYFIDKALKKIIPEALVFFLKPLLTMIIVVPVTLIILGPLGNQLSGYIAAAAIWITGKVNFIAQPLLAMAYPYMVMLGFDKSLQPIGIELTTTLGYNSVTSIMGFVSNLCLGSSCLALATTIKEKSKRGMVTSFAVTALCGVMEPAFYGGLISKPKALIGTAIGACTGGLIAGIIGLRTFVQGACPGLLTLLFFIDQDGGFYYFFWAIIVAAASIIVSFLATRLILKSDEKK